MTECSPWTRKKLRSYGQDPTTKLTCPGYNDACETAEAVLFPTSTDIFAPAVFSRAVDLRQYLAGTPLNSDCGTSGNAAFWKITPAVGTIGRSFTATTKGSNLSTLLAVWSGSCSNNMTAITCSASTDQFGWSKVNFTTDGTNNFYIVGQGATGSGKLKIRITSP